MEKLNKTVTTSVRTARISVEIQTRYLQNASLGLLLHPSVQCLLLGYSIQMFSTRLHKMHVLAELMLHLLCRPLFSDDVTAAFHSIITWLTTSCSWPWFSHWKHFYLRKISCSFYIFCNVVLCLWKYTLKQYNLFLKTCTWKLKWIINTKRKNECPCACIFERTVAKNCVLLLLLLS